MTQTIEHHKTRCDAKLLNLPEEIRERIGEWSTEGMKKCVQRIRTELKIEVAERTVYDALAIWRVQALYRHYETIAEGQAKAEAAAKGGYTAEQMEEAVDRYFIAQAVKKENVRLYQQMRYLRIADQKAKRHNRVAEAKLEQGARALRQKDKALELAERRVAVLEKKIEEAKEATTNPALSAEERAQRIREILGE